MNIYAKLMTARITLQSSQMKKSEKNKFVGYEYFELGDFIPHALKAFAECGLCGVVSFSHNIAALKRWLPVLRNGAGNRMNQRERAQRGASIAKTVFILVCLCGAIFLMQWRDGI